MIGKLEEKCSVLPSNYKKALSADPDEIMYTTPGDVGIFYDDNGIHQVLSCSIVSSLLLATYTKEIGTLGN